MQVGGRLIATAGDIKINHAVWTEHAKGIHALGREIDPALGGCCRDEEYFLCGDEFSQFRRNFLVPVRHWLLHSSLDHHDRAYLAEPDEQSRRPNHTDYFRKRVAS